MSCGFAHVISPTSDGYGMDS